MAAIYCFIASNLSSSIAMVVFGRLASLSNSGGGADLLGAFRGGRNQTCPEGARIPSRETQEVVAYFI
jgi:hypothetical protein